MGRVLMTPGTPVVWIRGSVGLSGSVTGSITIEGAEPQWRELLAVKTDRGTFHEFARNLRVRERMLP